MRASKPSLDCVSPSQVVLAALNFKRAICWFCWELSISIKQKLIIRGVEKKEEQDTKLFLCRFELNI